MSQQPTEDSPADGNTKGDDAEEIRNDPKSNSSQPLIWSLSSRNVRPQNRTLTWLIRSVLIALLILLPVLASWIFSTVTAMPKSIRMATGPENGRYRMIMQSLKEEIESELEIEVELVETEGSFENLELLRDGKVDLALFQSGSDQDTNLDQIAENRNSISFLANVYPELTQLLVTNRIETINPGELSIDRIALSLPRTADALIGEILIDHLGIHRGSDEPLHLAYTELPQAFADNRIDVAIVQVGIHTPVIRQVLSLGNARLVAIPNRAAFLSKHVAFSPFTVPQGVYVDEQGSFPQTDIETVSVSAQLLCRKKLHSELARKITGIVHRPDFAKRNELQKLFSEGTAYSKSKAEFPIHRGARRYYDPSIRPWINPEFVEATEGVRSFVVSMLIAAFFLIRWLLKWRVRSVEHRLDRYIHRLLDIEKQQMDFDFENESESMRALEELLDEVTVLRREALTEFSAHQLNDDPAITCFLDMSHALSEKISAKLTRGRIGILMDGR